MQTMKVRLHSEDIVDRPVDQASTDVASAGLPERLLRPACLDDDEIITQTLSDPIPTIRRVR